MLTKLYSVAAVYETLLRGHKVCSTTDQRTWELKKGQLFNEDGVKVAFDFANADRGLFVADDSCETEIERRLSDYAKSHLADKGSYPEKLFLRPDQWIEAIKVLREPFYRVDNFNIELIRGEW